MLNCIHTYMTSMKPMVAYKAGQDFAQKIMTYVQNYVSLNIYSLTPHGQLYCLDSWSED